MNRINIMIARVLSEERLKKGMTLKKLSEKSEIPRRTLDRVMQGERDINVSQLYQLATALDTTINDIADKAELYLTEDALENIDEKN
ncbi:helix-turn-helix domain-containing protein [Gardnerella sp. Marseille-Q9181]|uniref:helix-turn-helix domain-containing protein n=1 Tax=Gardnerella sp. Marseille-Q9181 TaxID=3383029 RepID=UPI003AF5C69C